MIFFTSALALQLLARACTTGPLEPNKVEKLKVVASHKISIAEPSDVALNSAKTGLYVVSDNGVLFQTDLAGNSAVKVGPLGYDYEGVFVRDGKVYIAEERTRRIIVLREGTHEQIASYQINYNGGRNKGIESLTYNEAKKCMIAITEKDPTKVFELSEDFVIKNEIEIDVFRDISSATYFGNKVWILSDEDHSIARLNPLTYEVEKKWKLDVINPEGLFFDAAGKLFIVSDDMARMFEMESSNLIN